jgi:hypothetical protein
MDTLETPFDRHAARVNQIGYHNHRVNTHSDIISDGIVQDLRTTCATLKDDLDALRVGYWRNKKNPWGRKRNTDLVVAEPLTDAVPQGKAPLAEEAWRGAAAFKKVELAPEKIRIVVEHKSIMTAHRNLSARHDDLNNLAQEAAGSPNVIVGATVMVGTAPRMLNVPDGIKKLYKSKPGRFERDVVSRMKKHNPLLWEKFKDFVSPNQPEHIAHSFHVLMSTVVKRRSPGNRNAVGYDAFLVVPVFYDNVNVARVVRDNPYGIDVDQEYRKFIERISDDYAKLYGPKE